MTKFLGLIVAATLLAGCGGGGPPTAGGNVVGGGNTGVGSGNNDTPVYSMGSGSGRSFQDEVIGLPAGSSSASLSAGGSTSLTVSIVNQDGVLYTGAEVAVSFNSSCIAQGLATINSPVSTTTGLASVTYGAKGCSGSDTVTAIATVGNQTLTAMTVLTVAEAAVGSIEFVSATPTTIALRGSGGPSRPETSTVIFRVKDSSGGARSNTPVRFDLVSALGGEATFDPAMATSDINGNVQTVVRSGTVATTVAIKGTVTTPGTSIFTQSTNLSISTGLTDGNSISLAVSCANVEALNNDGEIVQVTVRMADRFNNPAADGTPANFRTEGGKIGASCLATTTTVVPIESGVCTVNWVSQAPRPMNGRSSLLVSTTGEESFTDSNGNGVYDDNDSAFADRGEPFLDEDENGSRQMSEPFVDFNGNSMFDDVDGKFNGVLCNHSTNCSTQQSTAVSDKNIIVLSGSVATIIPQPPSTSTNLPFGTAAFLIKDENDNQMPGSTIVKLEVQDAKITGPSSQAWPCSSAPGGRIFSFAISPDGTHATGTATLTVTTPKGIVTIASYTVGA